MPRIQVNKKFSKVLKVKKPIKVLYGGRDSGKSLFYGDYFLLKMDTENADILCLREFQENVNESVHKVFKKRIKENNLPGFTVQENKIIAPGGSYTTYKGAARNPDAVKSAQDYKYSWFEEAQKASQESIDELLPTIIRNPGAECCFSANPYRSSDPFSKRFILPFLKQLNTQGYYEDELYLIIKVNWRDNPWYCLTPETELLRKWDYENLSRAKYDWIWEGAFYDGIEDALIMPEWFDACVDAHLKLGIEPRGIRMASFDPADRGDAKAFAFRHGIVFKDIQQTLEGDIAEGCDWACSKAITHSADGFTWDCDGIGMGLKKQVSQNFFGHNTNLAQFKGSEGPDYPDQIFDPIFESPETALKQVQNQVRIKDAIKNKRAQYYNDLQGRVYRTYEVITKGKYYDPDNLISFSSQIVALTELRAELCSIPVKPNRSGLFELYTKEEMKRIFKLQSPNLADVVMMNCRIPKTDSIDKIIMPPVMRTMGRTQIPRIGYR